LEVQGHIELARNFYSVPCHLIGNCVSVHFNSDEVVILIGETALCRHRTRHAKALASSMPDHRPHRLTDKVLSQEVAYTIKGVRGISTRLMVMGA
jgi:hypothetical protein